MTDLAQYQTETTELTDTELSTFIAELTDLLCETRNKTDRMKIDELLEEYLEEDQYRRGM